MSRLLRSPQLKRRSKQWWAELGFHILDLFAIGEIYETLADIGKWNTRPLSTPERRLGESVFGNSIEWRRVRVDETARIACKTNHLLYVSFFTINAWGRFRDEILIHELMHIWQFQHLGASYIPKALAAQFTPEGYNYGGVEALKANIQKGGSLLDFNFEQQADIIADYFCIREGKCPSWANAGKAELPVYEHFVKQVKNEK